MGLCLWAALIVPFLAFGILPLVWMGAQAIGTATPASAFGDTRLWTLLGRTVAFSLAVAVCATFLGAVAGYFLGSTAWRGKTIARALLILPLAIPPYLHAIGWTTLLRPRGWIVSILSSLLPISSPQISDLLYSSVGATLVLALAYFPIAMLFTEKSLALSSPSMTEAAQVFGANRWQRFLVARWPFLRPAVASSAMIIFLLAASDLGVPTILKVPVFNFEVFIQLGAFNDVTTATLLTIPLLFVGFFALSVERRLTLGAFLQADVQDVQPPGAATLGEARFNQAFFTLLTIVALGLPLGSIVVQGAQRDAFLRMAEIAQRPAIATIQYAGSTAVAITLIAFVLAWILRSAGPWWLRLTDWILVAGFAVPSTIVALALLAVYDRPGISGWVSPAVLVCAALAVRYVIIGYRIAAAGVAQIPDALFEAAAVDGAGPVRSAWHVFLPLTHVALLATLAITFVLAVGEIGSTIVLYPPGGETLPIALYAIEANSPRSYVAAMTLIQLFVSLVPLAAIALALGLPRMLARLPKESSRSTTAN